MSRITVIYKDKSFRCSAQTAQAYIEKGAELDKRDQRGCEAYHRHMQNRKPPKKPRSKTKSKTKE